MNIEHTTTLKTSPEMKALIIDGDDESAALAARSLTAQGYRCSIIPDGELGLELAALATHDIIILDIQLPGLSGLEVIRRLRERRNMTPVIVVSALSEPDDKVVGLNLGADDYLAKPFCPNELVARINAVLRRYSSHASRKIAIRGLSIDIQEMTVFYRKRKVELTLQEYKLLEYLALNAGRIRTIKMIYQGIWKQGTPPPTKVVEARVSHLRKKLSLAGANGLIHTVRGFGYVLK